MTCLAPCRATSATALASDEPDADHRHTAEQVELLPLDGAEQGNAGDGRVHDLFRCVAGTDVEDLEARSVGRHARLLGLVELHLSMSFATPDSLTRRARRPEQQIERTLP